jgi:hypothetical protein
MKLAVISLIVAVTAISAFGQAPPSLRIVTEDPNLPSELYYGDIKVKPLRLRPGTNQPMVFEDNDYFVFQHYVDFLGRMPDQAGYTDWNNVLNTCTNQGKLGADPACDRTHVSSGFFRSTEFGDKGYWIYRFYNAAFGRLPKYAPEFKPEVQKLSGLQQTGAQLEASKAAFIDRFMTLPEFTGIYGSPTAGNASQFIASLEQKAGVTLPASTQTDPGQPQQYTKQQLIDLMTAGTLTPAQTLRAFIEQKVVWDKYFYRAFVAMEYFGYLKRDPDQAGYDDWVRVLTFGDAPTGIQPGDYRHLVFGFIWSTEYRARF